MKITLYSRGGTGTGDELAALFDTLQSIGIEYSVNAAFADYAEAEAGIVIPQTMRYERFEDGAAGADIAVSYGGDGTFLDCVRLAWRVELPVMGVNSGRLGFLANITPDNMTQAFEDIAAGRYTVEQRTLLHISGDVPDCLDSRFAFNEFAVQRSGGGAMVSVDAYVDGEMVATYWGDGALVSTPAGSTAYSLSVGGPVVAPGCECLILAPIAPHNLNMRPVIIPDKCEISMRVHSRGENVFVSLDNTSCEVADGASFTIKRAVSGVFLVKLQNISFYDTLRNKMLWGIDRRDNGKER